MIKVHNGKVYNYIIYVHEHGYVSSRPLNGTHGKYKYTSCSQFARVYASLSAAQNSLNHIRRAIGKEENLSYNDLPDMEVIPVILTPFKTLGD